MIYWNLYKTHTPDLIKTKNGFYDNTIYTFDIETTSYYILYGKVFHTIEYLKLDDKEKKDCIFQSCMYIWMFGINDNVYYGRTWEEFLLFLNKIENVCPYRKILFIHNLSFEFQFIKSVLNFEEVIARKSHKVMKAITKNFNYELRCSYFMSNSSLEELPRIFNLSVKKQVGKLDYNKIRTHITPITNDELKYCEYDCLVVYEFIKLELETYKELSKIPITSTGHVRRELKSLVSKNYDYKNKVKKSINTDPHIYNLLVSAFAGRIYTRKLYKGWNSFKKY